jgi:leucyl-tRNA synthetase
VKDGAKMSKSRGNVVVPVAYIQQWGADTFRMYLMFLGPFQEGGDFRDTGITGIRRFLEKVWVLAHESVTAPDGPVPQEVLTKLHQTIRKVTADTESLNYNTAIAAMMEYVNLVKEQQAASKTTMRRLVLLLAPYAPHFAEELWILLGGTKSSVFEEKWPEYDETFLVGGSVEIAVQVNGKLRGRVVLGRGASEEQVVELALSEPSVKKFVNGDKIRKVVYVQDRLLNLVV